MKKNVRLALYIALAVVAVMIVGAVVLIALPSRARPVRYVYRPPAAPPKPRTTTYATFAA